MPDPDKDKRKKSPNPARRTVAGRRTAPDVLAAQLRVAHAQHRAALAGQQTALAALNAELVGLHSALGAHAQHLDDTRDRVYAVLEGLGAHGEIENSSTLDDLNLASDTVKDALNQEFWPGQNKGLSDDQVKGGTAVGVLILEIHDLRNN